jgi:hypothetical protein
VPFGVDDCLAGKNRCAEVDDPAAHVVGGADDG